MDDNSTRPLQYGHLGRAVYDPDTQSWSFARSLAPAPGISYTGVSKTTVLPTFTTTTKAPPLENEGRLPKAYPDLAPASVFTRHEEVSHVITATSDAYNPLASSLLDFGNALDMDHGAHAGRAIPIAVVAAGECSNIVSFRIISEDTVEFARDTNIRMRVPSIGEESAEWSAGGAPVREICFSRSTEENATFMAVRFSCSTAIFRPLFHRSPVTVRKNRHFDDLAPDAFCYSRLDPNFLVEIPSSHTGGYEHADVTFNPWNQKQLAVVDVNGNWGTWELASREKRNRGNWVAECLKSGSLPWLGMVQGRDIDGQSRHDGWLAIEWVGNDNNIVVCDRRCAMLYQMDSDLVSSYPIDLGFKRKSEWILDIQRSPSNSSHIYILTTTQIFWIDVTPLHGPIHDDSRPSIYPRLSWRHFRDADDTTLRLSPLLISEDFYLLLYSRLNRLAMAFNCPFASDSGIDVVSMPDPFILDIPVPSESEEGLKILPEMMRFSTLVFKEIAHSPSALGRNYYDPSIRLLKLFSVDSHLSVRESLYVGPSKDNPEEQPTSERDILRVKKRFLGGRWTKSIAPFDDFIVDDWDESLRGTFDMTYSEIPSVPPLARRQWTLDYTQIYAIVAGNLMSMPNRGEGGEISGLDFQSSLKRLEDRLSSISLDDLSTTQTAVEIMSNTPALDDVDQSAHDLNEFASRFSSERPIDRVQNQLVFQSADPFSPWSSFRNTSVEPLKLDLMSIYDGLINDSLTTFPQDVPGHTRITKEKTIRNIAADLILTQIVALCAPIGNGSGAVRSHNTVDASPSAPPSALTGNYVGEDNSFVPRTPDDSEWDRSRGNQATQSSLPIEEEDQAESSHTLSALSSFTTFKRDEAIAPSVERILDQWKLGCNPHEYTSTIRILGSQGFRPPATPKRKPQKQPAHSTPLDSSMPIPESSFVPVVWDFGTQPEQQSRASMFRLQSSQVTDDLPMTQVERGVFGGRSASRKSMIKARKKKRAAGF